ncbi:MAG: beta-ketoacyl-[acyl-carrier-protein] synthase family protein [Desulfatitalea sp.]|nr:beta-ketoacyl-[acyl-carrier-protein] synthase family protein [Desulfatitalea sp.]NNK00885.1 beta-ketoacyl-[acyl-carrier-protein] synthase family protein [Desulfatitalea sp.]
MKPALNRSVYVVGYDVMTPLGNDLSTTWRRAVNAEAGFRRVTRCQTNSRSNVVGEIPDWPPRDIDFIDRKERYNWNADFVFLTMMVCKRALAHAGLPMNEVTGPRTACLMGSALNGSDALRIAVENYTRRGPLKVSPYLLPNLCANLPAGKAGMLLKFTGPIFSPQGACASANHAIAIGARMIRDGDCDFVIAGGAETCLIPEIIQGFANMWATIKVEPADRAFDDPTQASRPFSVDRKGFVLAEGAGALVLAADEMVKSLNLVPKAEVSGIGWTSDANHFTLPHKETIMRAIEQAIDDAGLMPQDIGYVNAHGTSTLKGDIVEIESLRSVFGPWIEHIPVSSNKSQVGHCLGAAGAIEAVLGIEAMQSGMVLPTVNHIPDPRFADIDVVPNQARRHAHEFFLSNSFGFGGTNCCIVFRGV